MKLTFRLPDGSSVEIYKSKMSEDKAEMLFAGLCVSGVIVLFIVLFVLIGR